jgi:hypothetical protein
MISPDSIHAAKAVLSAFAGTRRADLAIEVYEKTAGMEGDQSIQIWHLLFSLMDLCESSGSDFDAILRKAQQAISPQAQGSAASELTGPNASGTFLLLVDLMAYCKAYEIDFAEIIADVRAERPTVNGEDLDVEGKMTMLNREKARAEILEAVRKMTRDYPDATYSEAREQSGLLGRIKQIRGDAMPTAQRCWTYVGLDRSKLVDEFTFTQEDLKKVLRPRLYPHQEAALEALRQTDNIKLRIR